MHTLNAWLGRPPVHSRFAAKLLHSLRTSPCLYNSCCRGAAKRYCFTLTSPVSHAPARHILVCSVTGTPVTPVVGFVQQDVGPLLSRLALSPEVCGHQQALPYRTATVVK